MGYRGGIEETRDTLEDIAASDEYAAHSHTNASAHSMRMRVGSISDGADRSLMKDVIAIVEEQKQHLFEIKEMISSNTRIKTMAHSLDASIASEQREHTKALSFQTPEVYNLSQRESSRLRRQGQVVSSVGSDLSEYAPDYIRKLTTASCYKTTQSQFKAKENYLSSNKLSTAFLRVEGEGDSDRAIVTPVAKSRR